MTTQDNNQRQSRSYNNGDPNRQTGSNGRTQGNRRIASHGGEGAVSGKHGATAQPSQQRGISRRDGQSAASRGSHSASAQRPMQGQGQYSNRGQQGASQQQYRQQGASQQQYGQQQYRQQGTSQQQYRQQQQQQDRMQQHRQGQVAQQRQYSGQGGASRPQQRGTSQQYSQQQSMRQGRYAEANGAQRRSSQQQYRQSMMQGQSQSNAQRPYGQNQQRVQGQRGQQAVRHAAASNYPPRSTSQAFQGQDVNRIAGAGTAGAAGTAPTMHPQSGGSYVTATADGGQYGSSPNDGKGKKDKKWNIVFYVSLAIAAIALIALAAILGMYLMGRSHNSKIVETANVSDFENVALADMTVDWEALRAINPEVVAWIYMPGTIINYPVVQTTNNEKYLYTEFNGSTQHLVTFGTIFVDYTNSVKFTDRNNFIYGHNMNDGSMFAPIAELVDSKAFNEHRTVYLLTPDGNFRLTSFACVHVGATDPIVQTKFSGDDAYTAYIQDKIDNSVVTPDGTIPKASEIKKSFAFSTCDDTITSDGRIILFAYVAESTSDYAGGLDSATSAGNGATQETMSNIDSATQATKTGE